MKRERERERENLPLTYAEIMYKKRTLSCIIEVYFIFYLK